MELRYQNHEVSKPLILSVEQELLIRCCQTKTNHSNSKRLETLIEKGLNWNELVFQAERQGVMPLVYCRLSSLKSSYIPTEFLESLRNRFLLNASLSLSLTHKLSIVSSLFLKNSIPMLPFKGLVLAALAYGNQVLRQSGDIDILVHARDYEASKKMLISTGYLLGDDHIWQCQFLSHDGTLNIDLHQLLMPVYFSYRVGFESLWERRQGVSVAGNVFCSLSNEDLLLYLCANISRDLVGRRLRFIQICDLAELIVRQDMNWLWVLEEANRAGCKRILFVGILLAEYFFGVKTSELMNLQRKCEPIVFKLASYAISALFPENNITPTMHHSCWYYCCSRERTRDKCTYLNWYLFLLHMYIKPSPRDKVLVELPNGLSYIYWIVRPVRVVIKIAFRRHCKDNP